LRKRYKQRARTKNCQIPNRLIRIHKKERKRLRRKVRLSNQNKSRKARQKWRSRWRMYQRILKWWMNQAWGAAKKVRSLKSSKILTWTSTLSTGDLL
jgi:hypothetical protein